LHKKFEGSKKLHVQIHFVFSVFNYWLSLRSLSYHRGSWSATRCKFLCYEAGFRSSGTRSLGNRVNENTYIFTKDTKCYHFIMLTHHFQ